MLAIRFFEFLMQRVEAGIGQPSEQGRPGRCRAAVGGYFFSYFSAQTFLPCISAS